MAGPLAADDGLPPILPNSTRGKFPRAAPPGTPPERLFGRYRKIRSHSARNHPVPVLLIVAILVGLGGVGAGLRYVPGSPFASHRSSAGSAAAAAQPNDGPLAPLPFRSAPVTGQSVSTTGFYSWALLDLRTGQVSGSANMGEKTTSGALVSAWLAADYLHRADSAGHSPTAAQLAELQAMLRDANPDAAERTYQADGGTASIQRLVTTCKLTDSGPASNDLNATVISARDTVRMGQCIAAGTAAGSKWTPWLMMTMREVRGTADFGIRQALPLATRPAIAISNGWLRASDHTWHVNCLAIGDTWALSVVQRFPATGNDSADLAHTRQVCQATASLLRDNDVPLS